MNPIFETTIVPVAHRGNVLARRAQWKTWSPAARRAFADVASVVVNLPAPREVTIKGCEPYELTYTYQLSRLSHELKRFAQEAAIGLLGVRPAGRLIFFSGLLEPPMTSRTLHRFFALLRAGVAQRLGDRRAALHAPVPTARRDDGFPLHADLFLTDRLMLVFDNVSRGNDGASVFVSRHDLFTAVLKTPEVPFTRRAWLRQLMDGRSKRDSFEELYEFLHGDNPWRRSLARELNRNQQAIRFNRGEGYLVDDRRWLHGRAPVRGAVPVARFRRLVYGKIR